MLDVLAKAEMEIRPLLDRAEDWHSIDVDYHDPRVERVWRQWGEHRISLHVIHPCKGNEDPLFHPHPWPSAMVVIDGVYEMTVGYSETQEPPAVACKMVASTSLGQRTCAFRYEMTEPHGWHAVRPLGGCCWTMMVSGRPWGRAPVEVPTKKLVPLEPVRVEEILDKFAFFFR